ncbi:MAG: Wzz/FepE/Etk N-terminal domain-containing protein [Acidobacteriota bacterium]
MIKRELTVSYLLQVVRRRIVTIILMTTILTTSAVIFALLQPNVYLSDTLILVEPQQSVQTTAGKPAITILMEREGMSTISQQILSRSHLELIINEFNLYEAVPMEQRVMTMRNNIQLELVKIDRSGEVGGFKLSYHHQNPRTAAEVANRLAGLFIDENTTARERMLADRLQFLKEQAAQSKLRFREKEQNLQQFKQKYLDRMPEQRDQNLKMVEQLNLQLATNSDAISRAQQERVYAESMLAQYQSVPKSVGKTKTASEPTVLSKEPTPLESQLQETRTQLAELRNKYTDRHPDVIRLSRRVSELEQKQVREQNKSTLPTAKPAEPQDTVSRETFETLADLTSKLKAAKFEIEMRNAEQNRIRAQLSLYQSRLETPPTMEPELSRLTLDYNSAKENYDAISNEMVSAQMAQELERKQKSMLFRILDPAKQPEKPYKPNRRRMALLGLMVGLAAGLGLAFYRELSDESLHTKRDAEMALGTEVLAVIPKV